MKSARKKYIEIKKTSNISEVEQIIDALRTKVSHLEKKLNDIVNKEYFERNRIQISDIRTKYEQLSSKLYTIDFRIERIENALLETRRELERHIESDLAKDFFNEVKTLIPVIDKTFNDLVEFNKQLLNNKIQYFEEVRDDLSHQKEELELERTKLVQNNEQYLSLIADNKIDNYYELIDELNQYKMKIATNIEILNSLRNFDEAKKKIEQSINRLDSNSTKLFQKRYSEKIDLFNNFFTPISKNINGEEPILIYEPQTNKFPVSIHALNGGTSTGTKKSLIAAYDIAYQKFAEYDKKKTPRFIIHDVLESIEGENLNNIITEVNKSDAQYIIAILSEKLDSSRISKEEQDKMRIIELSESNRLFEGKIN